MELRRRCGAEDEDENDEVDAIDVTAAVVVLGPARADRHMLVVVRNMSSFREDFHVPEASERAAGALKSHKQFVLGFCAGVWLRQKKK